MTDLFLEGLTDLCHEGIRAFSDSHKDEVFRVILQRIEEQKRPNRSYVMERAYLAWRASRNKSKGSTPNDNKSRHLEEDDAC